MASRFFCSNSFKINKRNRKEGSSYRMKDKNDFLKIASVSHQIRESPPFALFSPSHIPKTTRHSFIKTHP